MDTDKVAREAIQRAYSELDEFVLAVMAAGVPLDRMRLQPFRLEKSPRDLHQHGYRVVGALEILP